jgi:SAM-dependent methyltransferase
MTLAYRIMYRAGFMPWEQEEPIADLVELVDGSDALPPGRALDIGCGTGRNAVYCARRGWQVTGVDDVPLALRRARQYSEQSGQQVQLICADIAGGTDLGTGYSLLLDIGCLHGLKESQLRRAAANLTRAAGPGATLVMFAIARGAPKPAPVGIDPEDVPRMFPDWEVVASRPAEEIVMHGRLAAARPYVHRLVRRTAVSPA